MRQATGTPNDLPAWRVRAGSFLIIGHLLAVAIGIVAAPSGPWPDNGMGSFATPPQFAHTLYELWPADYLRLVGLASSYHFDSNRPAVPVAWFEARLLDRDDRQVVSFTMPNEQENWYVRHRQSLLARALADDRPLPPLQGERIAPPNRWVAKIPIWEVDGTAGLKLSRVPEHLIPRDRPVFRPSDRSLVLAHAYARHLCRTHGAASVELIRYTEPPIPPAVLFVPRSGTVDGAGRLVSSFGKLMDGSE